MCFPWAGASGSSGPVFCCPLASDVMGCGSISRVYFGRIVLTCKLVYYILTFSLYLSVPFNLKDIKSVEVVSYLEIYDGRTFSLETTLFLKKERAHTVWYCFLILWLSVFHLFSNFGVILRAGIISLVLMCFLPLYTPLFKHTVSLINTWWEIYMHMFKVGAIKHRKLREMYGSLSFCILFLFIIRSHIKYLKLLVFKNFEVCLIFCTF